MSSKIHATPMEPAIALAATRSNGFAAGESTQHAPAKVDATAGKVTDAELDGVAGGQAIVIADVTKDLFGP